MVIIKIILASLLSIVVMLAIAKLIGNKQISELNMFDYINGITVGSIAAEMSVSQEPREVLIAFVAMVVYGLVIFLFSILTIKSVKCRRFLGGRTYLLIENGKIFQKNLLKARLDVNDLLTKARVNGYFDISQINYAIMENNGEISFLPKSEYRPVNSTDLDLKKMPAYEYLNVNVIIDGKILYKNLAEVGLDENWLLTELKSRGLKVNEIFLASVTQDNTLIIYKYQHEKNEKNLFD